jgi:hypothetical protein
VLAITHLHVEITGPDPYIRLQLKDASLRISSPVTAELLGGDGYDEAMTNASRLVDFNGEHLLGCLSFDVPSKRGVLRVVTCVYLYSRECGVRNLHAKGKEDLDRGIGLALAPVQDVEKTYRRVEYIR